MAGEEDVNRLRAARDLAAELRARRYTPAMASMMPELSQARLARDIGRSSAPSPRTWAVVVELLSWSEQVAKAGS